MINKQKISNCEICNKEIKYLSRGMCKCCYNKWLRKNNPNYKKAVCEYNHRRQKEKYRSDVIFRNKIKIRSVEWRKEHPEKAKEMKKELLKNIMKKLKQEKII